MASSLSATQTISVSEVIPTSKSLSIYNVQFRMDIYPHKSSYIQFNLVVTKLPSNIHHIITYCRLSCKQTSTLFKKTVILNMNNNTICWPSNQLKLSETKNSGHLQFKCYVELLETLRNDNYIDFLSRSPLTTTTYPYHEWYIDQYMINKFKSSEPGQIYYNDNNLNNMWVLSCFPNGIDKRNEGQLILSLELIRLSPNISFIETNLKFTSNHKNIKHEWQLKGALFSYNKRRYSWPNKTFSNLSLSSMGTLSFSVNIIITKIGNIYGETISKSHWGQYGIMHSSNGIPPLQTLQEPSWSMEAVTSKSNQSSNHRMSPNNYKLPLIQSQTAQINNIDTSYNPYKQQSQYEQPIRSKTWNEESPVLSIKHSKLINDESEYIGIDEPDPLLLSQQSISSTNGGKSCIDKIKHPFGFHHDQTPRRYVRKSVLNHHDDIHKKNGSSIHDENGYDDKYDILYDDTNTMKQTIKVKLKNNSNSKGSVLHSKFVEWLFNVVQLQQYLPLFEKNGKADIRKVRHFKDKMLRSLGIEDDADRELILEEAGEFKKLQMEFDQILDKNKVLRPLKSKFRAHGILTVDDLHSDIRNKSDLARILGILDDDKIEQIWSIIHPSQSNLQLIMNKIKKKYNVTMNYMDSLMKDLNEIQTQMATTNIFSNTAAIQKQQAKIMNDYGLKLRNHHAIISKMTHHSKYHGVGSMISSTRNITTYKGSTNTMMNKLQDTLKQCAENNPSLTNELCNIIVDALKENPSQRALESALNRMGTIETQESGLNRMGTIDTENTDCSFPKMLTYTFDHLESHEVMSLIEDKSDGEQEKNNKNIHQNEEEDDEKVDKNYDINNNMNGSQQSQQRSIYNPFNTYNLIGSPSGINHDNGNVLQLEQ